MEFSESDDGNVLNFHNQTITESKGDEGYSATIHDLNVTVNFGSYTDDEGDSASKFIRRKNLKRLLLRSVQTRAGLSQLSSDEESADEGFNQTKWSRWNETSEISVKEEASESKIIINAQQLLDQTVENFNQSSIYPNDESANESLQSNETGEIIVKEEASEDKIIIINEQLRIEDQSIEKFKEILIHSDDKSADVNSRLNGTKEIMIRGETSEDKIIINEKLLIKEESIVKLKQMSICSDEESADEGFSQTKYLKSNETKTFLKKEALKIIKEPHLFSKDQGTICSDEESA